LDFVLCERFVWLLLRGLELGDSDIGIDADMNIYTAYIAENY